MEFFIKKDTEKFTVQIENGGIWSTFPNLSKSIAKYLKYCPDLRYKPTDMDRKIKRYNEIRRDRGEPEWDGWISMFKWDPDIQTWKIQTGLVPTVIKALEIRYNVDILFEDTLTLTRSNVLYSWNFPDPLWAHQKRIISYAGDNNRGTFSSPPGSGKSIMMARIAYEKRMKAVVFIDNTSIAGQLYRNISAVLGEEYVGIISSDEYKPIDYGLTIVMLQTAYSALSAAGLIDSGLKDDVRIKINKAMKDVIKAKHIEISELLMSRELVFYDETHRLSAPTYRAVAQTIDPKAVYGFSGTPWRNDLCSIEIYAGAGPLVITITKAELTQNNILLPADVYMVYLKHDKTECLKGRPTYQQLYPKILNKPYRINLIVNTVKILKSYKGMIVTNRHAHGMALAKALKESGLNTIYITGNEKYSARKKAVDGLLSGKYNVLISTVFGEGTDIKPLEYIIRGMGEGKIETAIKSLPNTHVIQVSGRVERFAKKNSPLVIDIFDDIKWLDVHAADRFVAYKLNNKEINVTVEKVSPEELYLTLKAHVARARQ